MAKKLNTAGAAARFAKLADTVKKEQKAVERTEIIPIDSIVINKDNIFSSNDTEESIAELAKNIEENGMLHNIVVAEIEPDKYLLISGERRTKAVKLLGRDKIKATIRSDLSELDILKMLFFANSETREYTNEEKIQIIEKYLVKLNQFESTSEKEAAKKFREYVSQAFNINERQASKLITITSELSHSLKELLYSDIIDINTAASLAQLPSKYQSYSADIINKALKRNDSDSENKKYATVLVLSFAKQVKAGISQTNTAVSKDRTSQIYHRRKLVQSEKELAQIIQKLESGSINSEQMIDLTKEKEKTEQVIEKYNRTLKELETRIEVQLQLQHSKIDQIYEDTISLMDREANFMQNESEQEIQTKKISKELKAVDIAVKRLIEICPSKELEAIQELLEQYKQEIEFSKK